MTLTRTTAGLIVASDFTTNPFGSPRNLTGTTPTLTVSGGAATFSHAAQGYDSAIFPISGVSGQADQIICLRGTLGGTAALGQVGPVSRVDAGADGYCWRIDDAPVGSVRAFELVRFDPAVTGLGSYASVPVRNTPYLLKLSSLGTTHKCYLDRVLRLTATDSVFPAGTSGVLAYVDGANETAKVEFLSVCRSDTITVTGLPTGWYARAADGVNVSDAAASGGTATLDCSTLFYGSGITLRVYNGNPTTTGVQQGADTTGVYGGDVWAGSGFDTATSVTLVVAEATADAPSGIVAITNVGVVLVVASATADAPGGIVVTTNTHSPPLVVAEAAGDAPSGITTQTLVGSSAALVVAEAAADAPFGITVRTDTAVALVVAEAIADAPSGIFVNSPSSASLVVAEATADAPSGITTADAPPIYPKAEAPALTRTFAIFVLDSSEQVAAVLSNADPNACPVWGDKHVRDLKGTNTYEFSCSAIHPDAALIKKLTPIVFRDLDGIPQLMTVTKVERHMDGESKYLTVYAEHSAQELLNEPLTAITYASKTTSEILTGLLAGTRWEPGQVDYDGIYTLAFDYGSVLAAIRQLSDASTLEVEWRVEFTGSRITGRYVDFVTRLGRDTGKVIEVGKDLQGITCTDDGAPIATAIYPIGRAASDGTRVTIAGVTWSKAAGDALDKDAGSPILEYPEATQVWGITPTKPRVVIKEYPDILSGEALIHAAYNDLCGDNGLAVPTPTYVIDVAVLEKAFASTGWLATHPYGREAMRLGDTVVVRDPTSPVPLLTTQRITRTEYSYADIATTTSIGG